MREAHRRCEAPPAFRTAKRALEDSHDVEDVRAEWPQSAEPDVFGGAEEPGHARSASRPSVSVERPALTISTAMQPGLLRRAGGNESIMARGLLARFCLVVPTSNIGKRSVTGTPCSPSARHPTGATPGH